MAIKTISWWLVGPEYWWADLLDENSNIVKQADGETGLPSLASLDVAECAASPAIAALASENKVPLREIYFDRHESLQYAEYYKGGVDG